MTSGRVKGAVLGLAALSLVVTGVGFQEPALAAGPRYDPTILPMLDTARVQQIRTCEPGLTVRPSCTLWHLW